MANDGGGRRPDQRYKALMTWQILLRNTDEDHGLTATDLSIELSDYGIEAEEHSIRRDVKALQNLCEKSAEIDEGETFGYRIEHRRTDPVGYRVSERPLSMNDLQLIASAIRSSRYLSKKQEKRLLDALGAYCSKYQLEELASGAAWISRDKTPNDRVPKNIRIINKAIQEKRKIRFQYLKYTLQNRSDQTPRRKGNPYILSPYKILISEGDFYVIAYDGKKIVHYRIDRMRDVRMLNDPRDGEAVFESLDTRSYAKRLFSMFSGEKKHVRIRFTNDLLDTAVDRFGATDAIYTPTDSNHFTVSVDVEVSNQFYAWVCGFRKKATILGPLEVVEGFQQFLVDIHNRYK